MPPEYMEKWLPNQDIKRKRSLRSIQTKQKNGVTPSATQVGDLTVPGYETQFKLDGKSDVNDGPGNGKLKQKR